MIFVDQSRDDGFSADGSQVGYGLDGLRFDVRGPLLPGLVRPVAVVMGHVLAEHQVQVAFTQDQDPVQQLAAERPHDARCRKLVIECAGAGEFCAGQGLIAFEGAVVAGGDGGVGGPFRRRRIVALGLLGAARSAAARRTAGRSGGREHRLLPRGRHRRRGAGSLACRQLPARQAPRPVARRSAAVSIAPVVYIKDVDLLAVVVDRVPDPVLAAAGTPLTFERGA